MNVMIVCSVHADTTLKLNSHDAGVLSHDILFLLHYKNHMVLHNDSLQYNMEYHLTPQ